MTETFDTSLVGTRVGHSRGLGTIVGPAHITVEQGGAPVPTTVCLIELDRGGVTHVIARMVPVIRVESRADLPECGICARMRSAA